MLFLSILTLTYLEHRTCWRRCDRFRDRCRWFLTFFHLFGRRRARIAASTTSRWWRWYFFLDLATHSHRRRAQLVETVFSWWRRAIRRRAGRTLARVVDHQILVALFTIALLSGRTRTALLRRIVTRGAWSTNLGYLHGLCLCPVPSSVSYPADVRAADRVCYAVYTFPVPLEISSSSVTKIIDIQRQNV